MARRRERGLRRVVETPVLAGTLFGSVAGGLFFSLGITADFALGLTPLVFVLAGAVFLLTLFSYIEGIAMLPQAGGSSYFARAAFNELVSFIAAWALMLDYLIIITISAFFAGNYLSEFPGFAQLREPPYDIVTGVVLIAVVALLNIRGVSFGARVNVVIAGAALISQVLRGIIGLVLLFDPATLTQGVDVGVAPSWGQFLYAIPVAMIAFTGVEVAANLSGELRNPGHEVPRPLIAAALVAVTMYVLYSVVGLMALPVHEAGGEFVTDLGQPRSEGGFQFRPIIGIVDQLPFGAIILETLRAYVGLLAFAVLFLTANVGITGVSRLAYSMSRHRQVPSAFGRIERRTGTPRLAIVTVASLAGLLLVLTTSFSDSPVFLAQLYAFGGMISYMIAHASIIMMRRTFPDSPRPFRAPLNVTLSGWKLPLTSVAGLLGAFVVWTIMVSTHDAARGVGFIWMVIGLVGYGTYRMSHGLSITRRYDPRVEEGIEIDIKPYSSVLLAIRPVAGARTTPATDEELTALAHKLLDSPHGVVAVMVVHELPLTVPLDAPLGEAEGETMRRLSRIRSATDKLGLRLVTTIARSRAAGRAICQEASRRDSDVIVMASPPRRRPGDAVFGKTVEYVLRHAPCDVAVLRVPVTASGAGKPRPEAESQVRSTGAIK